MNFINITSPLRLCAMLSLILCSALSTAESAHGQQVAVAEGSETRKSPPRQERFRPQYHFSMAKGWINDPNGLVYYDGLYHLFCQHNPDAVKWGPMHWSHAVSTDLVHWKEQAIALYPDKLGTCFSGSAVVDWRNTSGLGRSEKPPLLAFYTAAGALVKPRLPFTQCLAFSTDNGRSWSTFKDNPVLGHVAGSNRDPKVFWHERTRRWIMVLYLTGGDFGLFGSPDALKWEPLSRFTVPGNNECPDLFEMPVVGEEGCHKWVFLSGAGQWARGDCARYVLGDFDGVNFKAESKPIPIERGGWNYSTQTYSDAPHGRRIFIGWFSTQFDGSRAFPGNPFNGQYRVPWELTLVKTDEGLRLAKRPVEELKKLRGTTIEVPAGELAPGDHPVQGLAGRSLDIECQLKPGKATSVGVVFEGVEAVSYDVASRTMRVLDRKHVWPLESDETLKLRILFDVNCVEVFGPDGLKVMSGIYSPDSLKQLDERRPRLSLRVDGEPVRVPRMAVYPMRSIWEDRGTATLGRDRALQGGQ
jgi:sucrose-6-phosphate hydrolase SacC (GH32 family)